MYTLLLTDGSFFIDQAGADRVREALRLDVASFLMFAKECGSDEPDRLVSVKSDEILTLIAHDAAQNPAIAEWRAAKRSRNVLSIDDYIARRLADQTPVRRLRRA